MNAQGALLAPFTTKKQLAGTAFVHLDGCLHAAFGTSDFASALELVNRIGQVAEQMNHHPDVRLGYGTVSLTLTSHDAGGVTIRDLDLAARVQQIADTLGATARPAQSRGAGQLRRSITAQWSHARRAGGWRRLWRRWRGA